MERRGCSQHKNLENRLQWTNDKVSGNLKAYKVSVGAYIYFCIFCQVSCFNQIPVDFNHCFSLYPSCIFDVLAGLFSFTCSEKSLRRDSSFTILILHHIALSTKTWLILLYILVRIYFFIIWTYHWNLE